MERRLRRAVAVVAGVALALGVAITFAEKADAAEAKSTQTEAIWVAFDPAAKTVAVKIKKPGIGPGKDQLKAGEEKTFTVEPEGSVLTRTSVAVNGVKGELKDIPAGKQVNIYWVPDPKKPDSLFARKIDVVLSDAELDARAVPE